MKNILIAITDDDDLIVKLLESFLSTKPNYQVIFTANSGEGLIEQLKEAIFLPDILLLDLKMKSVDGIEVTQFLKQHYPSIKVIIISSHYQHSSLGFMIKTGASAFVPKGINPQLLETIINTVNEKGIYFMEDQISILRDHIKEKLPEPNLNNENILTAREIEVLKLITEQKTSKEISDQLNITTRTVEGHRNNLFVKCNAKNIAGLVIYAIQHRIVDIEEYPTF